MFLKILFSQKECNFKLLPVRANVRRNKRSYIEALNSLKMPDEEAPIFPVYDLRYLRSFRE